MKSIWYQKQKRYESLKENIKTDILVIGGGLAGILTAYQLAKKHQVVLVEKGRIASGATAKTTGKISSLQGTLYQNLIKEYGLEFAKKYFESQQTMVDEYQKIIEEHHINCDFEITNGVLFASDDLDSLIKEYHAFTKMGVEVKLIDHNQRHFIPKEITFEKALVIDNQAIFNPLKFINQLPKNFLIYENSEVLKILGNIALGKDFSIEAQKIIIATQFPIKDIPGSYFAKLHPSMAYTIAIPDCLNINGAYLEVKENGMSYRNYQDYLLVCGLDHRTGRDDSDNKLKELVTIGKNFSPNNYEYYWTNEDMMTFDNIPYIGKYSLFSNNLFVITGFNKWGMANSLLASLLISDLIENHFNPYTSIFSPTRVRLLKHLPSVIVNGYVNAKNILSSFLIKPKHRDLARECAGIMMINGQRKSVYVDKEGIKHYAPGRCEHLKSHLDFNPNTLTWDCPCHGSRYTIDGKVIHGPAQND